MKKRMSLIIIMILLSSMLAGCGGSSQESNKNQSESTEKVNEKTNENVKLTLMTTEASGAEALAYYEGLIGKYEADHPGVEIELIQGGNWQDVEAKLSAASLSNTYPDILLVPLSALGSRASLGEYADLTEYIANWADADDIMPAAIDIGKYKGTNVAIGAYPVPEIIMYRKDFFIEAGLDPDKPPTTWDELYEYATKLAQVNENGEVIRGGFDVPIAENNMTLVEAFLRQNGNYVIDPETEELFIADQSSIETFEYLKQFIDMNLTVPYRRSGNDDPVLTGKSAMGIVYPYAVAELLAENPDLKENLGFIPFVENEQKGSFCGYRLMMISEESQYKDEAWDFIASYYDTDEMWKRYELFNHTPIRLSMSEEFINLDPELNQALIDCVEYGAGRPVVSWLPILTKYQMQAYEEIMNDVKSASQALNDAEASIKAELSQMQR